MTVYRTGDTPENGDSPAAPKPSRRRAPYRYGAIVSVVAAVAAFVIAGLATTASADSTPSVASVAFADNCDGTVTVTVTNPSGNADAAVLWSGSSQGVPGDGQEHQVVVPASAGLIVVSRGLGLSTTHTWTDPGDCPPPTTANASPTPGADSTTGTAVTLPVTGGSLTGLLWVGSGLLFTGIAILLFMSDVRSRRDKATQA